MEYGCIGAALEVKFSSDEAKCGEFEGYGAVFGNIDSHGDVIEPGAFAKSLLDLQREGRPLPPLYKQHGMMTGNAQEPIGVWTEMKEDVNGLYVKGRLIGLDTERGRWTHAQMKEGALKGLSIGYRIPPHGAKAGSGKPGEPKRYIKTALLREVSLVDTPSNALAQVYAMKARDGVMPIDEIKTIREFEAFLRDVGGFSHQAAKAIAAGGFKASPEPRDEDGVSDHIKAAFADLAQSIRK